jgi:hypothetical protein
MQAGYPVLCEHDFTQPQSLDIPKLPDEFSNMGEEEKFKALVTFRLDEANLYYTAATGIHNDEHMNALKIPHLGMRQYLVQQTGYPWDGDLINLRAALIGITSARVWSDISSISCPVSFTDEEKEVALRESREWNESEILLSTIRNNLGIDLEGGTDPDNFDWAHQKNLELRREMLRQSEEHERENVLAKLAF